MNKLRSLLFSHKRIAIIIFIVLIAVCYFGGKKLFASTQSPQYQTSQVERGTLISSISASGQITTGSNIPISTQVSGIVKTVYVKNGDQVTAGQTLAEITLDQVSSQKQAAAWASYLSAQNSLSSAQTNLYTLQNTLFVANQKFITDAVARTLKIDDPTYIEENATWLAAEATYKNQQNVIAQVQVSLNSAWLSYQQSSSIITAPIGGRVSNLILSPGYAITQSTSSSTTSTSSSQLGSIAIDEPTQALVNLSEMDIVKVNISQKVTLTLDAFPDKTFTGKVASINTSGVVSSGVTNYPVTISFDSTLDNIYPNMAVSAGIITEVKDNVLLVPSASIQNNGDGNIVRVLKNGQVSSVAVTTGSTSDTQTEITSGISEGDEVITSVVSQTQSNSIQSPFSSQFRIGGGGATRFGGN
ncbi:MAG: efflux RND transporter periplasmic adaptor subunit [Candidatus Daviesbacteria bacterium]